MVERLVRSVCFSDPFSALGRLKTYFHSITTHTRLNSLLLCHIRKCELNQFFNTEIGAISFVMTPNISRLYYLNNLLL